MVTRSAKSYLQAYKTATDFFRSKNCLLDFFRLDNETSGPLKKFMKANARTFQYVSPNNHRANMVRPILLPSCVGSISHSLLVIGIY